MEKIKLTKREYQGEVSIDTFQNETTNEILNIEIPEKDYNILGRSPKKEGYKFVSSSSGVVKLDKENLLPELGDWWVKDGQNYVCVLNEYGTFSYKKVNEDDIVDFQIDSKIIYG